MLVQVSRPNSSRHEQARLLQPEPPRAILCYPPLTHQSSPLVSRVDMCSWFSLLVVEPIGLRFIARPTGCAIFIRYRLYGFAVRIQVAQLQRLSSEGRFFCFLLDGAGVVFRCSPQLPKGVFWGGTLPRYCSSLSGVPRGCRELSCVVAVG